MTASAEQSSSSLNYNTSTNNNHYNSNNNANNNNVKRKQINEKAFDNDNSLIMKMSVEQWSYNDVAKWLTSIGFEHYANWIAFEHKIDGATLLTLTERDLREKPVEMQCLGDIKHLSNAISSLRNESFIHCSNSKSNLSTCSSSCHLNSHVHLPYANDINENSNASTLCADHQDGFVPIMNVNHGMYTEPTETSGMNLSSRENASGETRLIQVLTREHLIRQTYPPLPDIVLDNLPLIPWAFEVCELIGVVLSSIWFIILFFHKHR
ncbi:unnamed protein product [Anisakis simplex]|uniref:Sphingomyelin synthase-related 1 (inferred by orthology to a C. elegans protein) n=1 Tax=Anisakis simplex TaxID=6269 RepID=A0A0M3K8R6_ANISI|nr:unnamed protein product [Anisakis simplex]